MPFKRGFRYGKPHVWMLWERAAERAGVVSRSSAFAHQTVAHRKGRSPDVVNLRFQYVMCQGKFCVLRRVGVVSTCPAGILGLICSSSAVD